MRRIRGRAVGALVGVVVIVAGVPAGAQFGPPPGPPVQPGPTFEGPARQFGDALGNLAANLNAAPPTPAGQYLARDVQELQQAAAEWYNATRGGTDPYQVRRSFSGVDISWQRLRGQLAAPGVATPAMLNDVRAIEQAAAQIRQGLNVNDYPNAFEGVAPTTGFEEVRRLAYAAAQKGDALAAVVRADYPLDAYTSSLANDAATLAQQVDGFYDGLTANPSFAQQPDLARQAYLPIIQKATGLGIALDRGPMPPRVRQAWQDFATTHTLLRGQLGLNGPGVDAAVATPPPAVAVNPAPIVVAPPVVGNPDPYAGFTNPGIAHQVGPWADQLDGQINDLLVHFGPTVRVVPEGRFMLEDMERMRGDLAGFRQAVAQGAGPGRLAYLFRPVDADWQRLARRVSRIARGRSGPNINRVGEIGQTLEQMHRALGMPGYPPAFRFD